MASPETIITLPGNWRVSPPADILPDVQEAVRRLHERGGGEQQALRLRELVRMAGHYRGARRRRLLHLIQTF